MKVLKILGILLLVLIVVVVVLGFIAPKDYDVERSVVIDSPKELVFGYVKYWRNWKNWSPWAADDPSMQVAVEGADGQVGAIYKWIGDPDITGKGEMTNTGIKDGEEITYHLHFMEPWESESDGYVRLADADGGTKVSWGFYGETPFPWNVFMLFSSMDKMVGGDFERGLGLMKELCEEEAGAVLSYQVKSVNFGAKRYAALQQEVQFHEMQDFFDTAFKTIENTRRKKGLRAVGAPSGLYYSWDEQNLKSNMAAVVPVNRNISSGDVKTIRMSKAKAYSIDYQGPYSGSVYAHRALDYYLKKNGLKWKPPVIEEYVVGPATEADSTKWLTKIYYFTE
jgi:effector-binding domain-containing protein